MSRILMTGMTAGQTSAKANQKTLSFAEVINRVLRYNGHVVDWMQPDMYWTADHLDSKYDAIIVGLAPITSVAANYAYGALSVIEHLFFSSKLCMYLDAPMPQLVAASITSVASGQTNLTKPFFSQRKQYQTALYERRRLNEGVKRLHQQKWPTTIYPRLPWESEPLSKGMLPSAGPLLGVNYDSILLNPDDLPRQERDEYWAIDSYRTKWAITTAKSIVNPTTPMRPSRATTDDDVQDLLATCLGAIISPQKTGGTWWNYRYIQALNTETPIATEWRDSSMLGPAWSLLPSRIESLSFSDRMSLAHAQKNSYLSSISSLSQSVYELETLLGLDRPRG